MHSCRTRDSLIQSHLLEAHPSHHPINAKGKNHLPLYLARAFATWNVYLGSEHACELWGLCHPQSCAWISELLRQVLCTSLPHMGSCGYGNNAGLRASQRTFKFKSENFQVKTEDYAITPSLNKGNLGWQFLTCLQKGYAYLDFHKLAKKLDSWSNHKMNKKPRDQSAMVCCRKRKISQVLSSLGLVNLQPESGLDKIRAQIDHQKPEKYSR